ncbi:MAG: SUMF1/EgtB/PvdO family nonheme iron enzyme [Candidatus Poribacteria bacterium]|nr:SUMF1/EgtB/PvdO family nonheme iron enzyme [Candidatus Poribacteria bacterium]
MKNRNKIIISLSIIFLHILINIGITAVPDGMVIIPAGNDIDMFYIDKYEVTNAEYKKFIDANPLWQKNNALPSIVGDTYLWGWKGNMYPKGREKHPVVNISWFAAKAYAEWVGKELPTQAQWEKAARGSMKDKKYAWGDESPQNKANYNRYTETVSYRKPPTMEVGSYPPNEYGVYAITGNVDEWCLDRLDVDDIHGRYHIMRGGSWFDTAEELEISLISQHPVYDGMATLGFRCVITKDVDMSSDVASDMSSWLYEKVQNGFDNALYSVNEGYIPESKLEEKFEYFVKYFTGYSFSFEKELNRALLQAIAEYNPNVNVEEYCIIRDTMFNLWKYYLEIHFRHYEISTQEKLGLLRGCILQKIDCLFIEDGC